MDDFEFRDGFHPNIFLSKLQVGGICHLFDELPPGIIN